MSDFLETLFPKPEPEKLPAFGSTIAWSDHKGVYLGELTWGVYPDNPGAVASARILVSPAEDSYDLGWNRNISFHQLYLVT